ncbi:hypothetical protein MHU86_25084 [Fragilaria crotonensis]|nr:hypothetical protein MHU86_25084 [Fragilaria crotonensis]
MGVRPGTVDGRVPQQTPRRTPRTLSEYAARDRPAGTHAHEPSRPRHVADAPHLSPACDDPSRNEVGPGRYAPPSTRHRPTTVARALSPGDAHDAPTSALADTPRPLPAVQRPDAGIRVSPPNFSPRSCPPTLSGRVFRSASPKGRVPLREISDSDRLADVRANLARGNHKSARGHEAKLISMLKDEASRGWQLPLPRAALEIKGCEVAPLGMVAQTSIDERKFNRELRLTRPVIQPERSGRTKRKRTAWTHPN